MRIYCAQQGMERFVLNLRTYRFLAIDFRDAHARNTITNLFQLSQHLGFDNVLSGPHPECLVREGNNFIIARPYSTHWVFGGKFSFT